MSDRPLLRSMLVPGDQPRVPRVRGTALVFGGQMADAPIVAQAERILSRARRGGSATRAGKAHT